MEVNVSAVIRPHPLIYIDKVSPYIWKTGTLKAHESNNVYHKIQKFNIGLQKAEKHKFSENAVHG